MSNRSTVHAVRSRVTTFNRWCVVAALALAVVGLPFVVRALPVGDEDVDAAGLLERIEASEDRGYSGYVETLGTLDLPVADRFTDIAAPVRRAHPAAGVVARSRHVAGGQAARDGGDRPRPRRAGDDRVELRAGPGGDQPRPARSGCRGPPT